jgi:hypothetical protein
MEVILKVVQTLLPTEENQSISSLYHMMKEIKNLESMSYTKVDYCKECHRYISPAVFAGHKTTIFLRNFCGAYCTTHHDAHCNRGVWMHLMSGPGHCRFIMS